MSLGEVLEPLLVLPGVLAGEGGRVARRLERALDEPLHAERRRLGAQRLHRVPELPQGHESAARQRRVVGEANERVPRRRALVAAHALDLLDRLRADAARGHVDDTAQSDRVLRGEDEPEVREDVLHLLPLVEADASEDEVRDARAKEALFHEPALRVHAHEDGHPPPAAQARRARRPRGLLELVHRLVDAHRLAAGPDGPQRLALAAHVAGDEGGGHVEDRLARAVVVLEAEDTRPGEVALEVEDVLYVGPAPGVDRLVLVTHDREVSAGAGEEAHALVLRAVRVLVLVDEHVRVAPLPRVAHRLVRGEERLGAQQQVVEVEGARGGEDRVVALLDALGQ